MKPEAKLNGAPLPPNLIARIPAELSDQEILILTAREAEAAESLGWLRGFVVGASITALCAWLLFA